MTRLNETQMELVKAISQECSTPAEVTSLLKTLFAGILEQMLQAEMDEHLGYNIHSPEGDNTGRIVVEIEEDDFYDITDNLGAILQMSKEQFKVMVRHLGEEWSEGE